MNKHESRNNTDFTLTNSCKQSGISYVEYLVVTLVVIFVLFAPLPGHGGEAVFDLVLEAVRNFGINSSLLLSLP